MSVQVYVLATVYVIGRRRIQRLSQNMEKLVEELPRRTGTISANYENCVLNLRFHLSAKLHARDSVDKYKRKENQNRH